MSSAASIVAEGDGSPAAGEQFTTEEAKGKRNFLTMQESILINANRRNRNEMFGTQELTKARPGSKSQRQWRSNTLKSISFWPRPWSRKIALCGRKHGNARQLSL